MSNKSKLYAAIMSAAASHGGSHLTREAYKTTAKIFTDFMHAHGYHHVVSVADICGKHFRGYLAERQLVDGLDVGTLQKEASHLRVFLRERGRSAVADAPELSNKSLKINGRSRVGTNSAISDEELQAFKERCARLKREEMWAVILLERWLGLRANEALHARSDTLNRWIREIVGGGKIRILAGAKGNLERDVHIHFIDEALNALTSAAKLAGKQNGFLIVRKNGKPAGGLEQARSIYHNFCTRSGIQPHSTRYAFAKFQLEAYLSQGYSEREALIRVSHDLGHGDGRGRYVKSVYTK